MEQLEPSWCSVLPESLTTLHVQCFCGGCCISEGLRYHVLLFDSPHRSALAHGAGSQLLLLDMGR